MTNAMKPHNIQSGMRSVKIPESNVSVAVPEGCEILLSGVEESWAEGWKECNVHLNLDDGSILTGTASWEASGNGSDVVNPVDVKDAVERMLNSSEPSTPQKETPANVVLESDDLFEKFGFGSEDDYCGLDGLGFGIDVVAVLRELLSSHLLPSLNQRVVIKEVGSTHNKFRASTVDGEDAETWRKNGGELTPDSITIPWPEVVEVAKNFAKITDRHNQ